MSNAKNSKNVQYKVTVPKSKISFLMNAENGRDARSKVLKTFKGVFAKKLRRDDLKSERVAITELPARGRVKA